MREDEIDRATEFCREAAVTLDRLGSFRSRVLMQMLLIELRKEQDAVRRPASSQPAAPGPERGGDR